MLSKALFFLLLAVCAFVAFTEARPVIYTARLDDTQVNATNGYVGIAWGYVTTTKGRNNHRIRILLGHNIEDNAVTSCWLTYDNGTQIEELGISPSTKQGTYAFGDFRINMTVYDKLHFEDLQIRVYTKKFSDGAIGGHFRSRPYTAVAYLTGTEAGVNTTSNGLAYTYISNQVSLPLDLVDQTNLLLSNSSFDAVIIANVSNATAATINGPANSTSTAPALLTLSPRSAQNGYQTLGFQPVNDSFFSQQMGLTYSAVTTSDHPSGAIRGQLVPTLGRTRRAVPNEVDTIYGTTDISAGWRTLRYANQQDNERNHNSFITLTATQQSAASNYTYQGFFIFPSALSRRNFDSVRGLSLEINARLSGDATWYFAYFDATTGQHIMTASFSTSGPWTPGFADYFNDDASTFNTIRKQLVVRVTVDSPTSTSLWLDLFAVRSYVPNSVSTQYVRDAILQASLFPTELGSENDD